MRMQDVTGGVPVAVSNREHKFCCKIKEANGIKKNELNERDLHLAKLLTSRGVLSRENNIYNLLNKEVTW